MKDKIANVTRWILYLLLLLSVIPGILFYTGTVDTDVFLNWGKFMLIAGVAVIIIAPIFTFAVNPQNLIKMLISIVLFVVIIGLSYTLATNQLSALQLEEYGITPETSRLVGMGLIATYITFGLAIFSILFSMIIKPFK
jgi:hypothetical protein